MLITKLTGEHDSGNNMNVGIGGQQGFVLKLGYFDMRITLSEIFAIFIKILSVMCVF